MVVGGPVAAVHGETHVCVALVLVVDDVVPFEAVVELDEENLLRNLARGRGTAERLPPVVAVCVAPARHQSAANTKRVGDAVLLFEEALQNLPRVADGLLLHLHEVEQVRADGKLGVCGQSIPARVSGRGRPTRTRHLERELARLLPARDDFRYRLWAQATQYRGEAPTRDGVDGNRRTERVGEFVGRVVPAEAEDDAITCKRHALPSFADVRVQK